MRTGTALPRPAAGSPLLIYPTDCSGPPGCHWARSSWNDSSRANYCFTYREHTWDALRYLSSYFGAYTTFLMLIKCHLQQAWKSISCGPNLWLRGSQNRSQTTMAGQQNKCKTIEGQHCKEQLPRLSWETNQSGSQRILYNAIHHDITYKKKTGSSQNTH